MTQLKMRKIFDIVCFSVFFFYLPHKINYYKRHRGEVALRKHKQENDKISCKYEKEVKISLEKEKIVLTDLNLRPKDL